ncbi:MAG: rRNA maturation RNase YbeY [Leptolyngbya sp. BL-A-14]
MDVEVCVQENLGTPPEGEEADWVPDPTALPCPIATETWECWFQAWLEALQPKQSPLESYELSLRLTGDREIQQLNHHYRQQDKPTDVLAFAALESEYPQPQELQATLPLYLGDIVISVGTAQQQAEAQNHPLRTELAWLAAHGLLHLLGWDHPDEDSLNRMLKQQQVLLEIIGLKSKTG